MLVTGHEQSEMFKALFLFFYFGTMLMVMSFPKFKFIKYDQEWKIFRRHGDESCSYYEEVNYRNDFLTVKNGSIWLANEKILIEENKWERQDCPEVVDGFNIMYSQEIGTDIWFNIHNNEVNDVKDYDVEACKEYENFRFYGLWTMVNPKNLDCIDLVLQNLEEVDNKFLLVAMYDNSCEYGYIELEENNISLGKV